MRRSQDKLASAIPGKHCPDMETNPSKPAAMVFWIIWFAILNGLFIIQFVVVGGFPKGENLGQPPTAVIATAATLALLSIAIRFLAIPKTTEPAKLLPLMVVGLAFAEAIGIIGIFVVEKDFPQTRIALFVTSVSAILTYAPFYIHTALDRNRMR